VEQDNLYRQINFDFPPETPGMQGPTGFMPPYQNPGRVNADQSRARVPIYLCPSDGTSIAGDWAGANNYYANQGTSFLCDISEAQPSTIASNEQANGPFYFLSKVDMAGVTDGLSNTVLFSEKLRGNGIPNPRSDMFSMPNQNTAAACFATCKALNPATATPLTSKQGASWVMGEMCCTTYNHMDVPNTVTCAGIGFPGNMSNMAMQVPPSSKHPGGVQCLMGDGSVRFVRNSITLAAWQAMGSMNGGEVNQE
jgi:prepilin-type processing-associated H-X9-DG protein